MFASLAELLTTMSSTLRRIVSGGQTGVDRAALDVGLAWGLPIGGWCPRGRTAEDGPIPARYPLRETESAKYDVRTRRNVRDSDGTLILTARRPRGRYGVDCCTPPRKSANRCWSSTSTCTRPRPQVRDWGRAARHRNSQRGRPAREHAAGDWPAVRGVLGIGPGGLDRETGEASRGPPGGTTSR